MDLLFKEHFASTVLYNYKFTVVLIVSKMIEYVGMTEIVSINQWTCCSKSIMQIQFYIY